MFARGGLTVGWLVFSQVPAQSSVTVSQKKDGVLIGTPHYQLHVEICGGAALLITGGVGGLRPSSAHQSWIIQSCKDRQFPLAPTDKVAALTTPELQVNSGGLSFTDKAGHPLLTGGVWDANVHSPLPAYHRSDPRPGAGSEVSTTVNREAVNSGQELKIKTPYISLKNSLRLTPLLIVELRNSRSVEHA